MMPCVQLGAIIAGIRTEIQALFPSSFAAQDFQAWSKRTFMMARPREAEWKCER
jgi:hypothetical protein